MSNEHLLYSRTRGISKSIKFDREFLANFKDALIAGDFSSISFKLPHNLIKDSKDEITYEEFVQRERNYPSTILCAKNPTTSEMIKVFFVNYSTKAYFKDDTFPSGHSELPAIYVFARPDRLSGLFDFYSRFFRNHHPIRSFMKALLNIVAVGLLLLEVLMISQLPDLWRKDKGSIAIYSIASCLTVGVLYILAAKDTGLYVREKEKPFPRWLRQLLHGDYKDNPLVILFLGILGVLIGGILLEIVRRVF